MYVERAAEGVNEADGLMGSLRLEGDMANVQWQISGEYCEACSCDSVCPCATSGRAARRAEVYCDAGFVFRDDRGQYGGTRLDGLSFAVLLHTPGPMIQ